MIAIFFGFVLFFYPEKKKTGEESSCRKIHSRIYLERVCVYDVRSDCIQNNDDFRKGNADQ